MHFYTLDEKHAALIRKELDPDNKQGIYRRILRLIEDKFYHGKHYALIPDDLEELATNLRYFEYSIPKTWLPACIDMLGDIAYFDFYTDVCNVFELIQRNTMLGTLQWGKEEAEPVLIIETENVLKTLKQKVDEYLNKESEE